MTKLEVDMAFTRRIISGLVAGMESFFPNAPLLRTESWGNDFPEKRFLVVRRKDSCAGLFSYVATTLGWIKYAEENSMIPVVDLARHKNIYQSWADFIIRRLNTWEMFFDQPAGLSVSDISHARNVVVADGVPRNEGDIRAILQNRDLMHAYRRLAKRWLRPKLSALAQFDNVAFNCAIGHGVIGALARGTDFFAMKPHGHAVQPDADEIICMIRDYQSSYRGGRFVYLVTEDVSIADRFKAEFGDDLLLPLQDFVSYKGGLLAQNESVAHNKRRGLAYLKAVIDLSRCDSLFSGINNGALGAMIFSSGFKSVNIVDHGDYD